MLFCVQIRLDYCMENFRSQTFLRKKRIFELTRISLALLSSLITKNSYNFVKEKNTLKKNWHINTLLIQLVDSKFRKILQDSRQM